MYGIIVTLIVIVAVLLILVVLAQNPKGGGLSSQFGGSGTTQLMGVKKTGDLLEKLTWGFAIALLILSVSTNFIQPDVEQDVLTSPNIDNAQTTQPAIPQGIQPADAEASGLEDLTEGTATDSTGN
ncbi:preprotein translocase subunit SecG [Ekhidna sp. MALMAid0563]|uniref:preprotein translocase subunit SecG n=1 Tax=Ekhidna sp. MALMAid0563 TaxID=3143937 RepID=UPI0032DFBE49